MPRANGNDLAELFGGDGTREQITPPARRTLQFTPPRVESRHYQYFPTLEPAEKFKFELSPDELARLRLTLQGELTFSGTALPPFSSINTV